VEKSADIDALDSRMQQTTWVAGTLWGAMGTAVSVSSQDVAGVEWFAVHPSTASGTLTATLANQGYVALGNNNLTMPALAITSSGTGVLAFTLLGSSFYPSAGYATVTSSGVGAIHVAAAGSGPDDGFSDYKL